MTINGPQFDPIYRVEAVDYSGHDEDREEKKQRRRVRYGGHDWAESEDDLLLDDKLPKKSSFEGQEEKKKTKPLVIERKLLEKAQQLLVRLTTLEDKVAQLLFFKTEASYDPAIQTQLAHAIRDWQLGGMVFVSGSYKRQAYLVDHYQEFATLPLLIGNDFLHNLSFYFHRELPKDDLSTQHYRDLGKAVMGQNRSLGVHFLFDREASKVPAQISLTEQQKNSFRKGVRQAHGVVARDLSPKRGVHRIDTSTISLLGTCKASLSSSLKNDSTQQFIGMRTLFLQECSATEEELLTAFDEGYEAFLLEDNVEKAIGILTTAIKKGRIKEEDLDKRLLKLLVIKAYFQS